MFGSVGIIGDIMFFGIVGGIILFGSVFVVNSRIIYVYLLFFSYISIKENIYVTDYETLY